MRLNRLSVPLTALALAVVMGPAAPAHAKPYPPAHYPPAHPVITVSDGTIVKGETVEVTGTGFARGETITYVIHCSWSGMSGGLPHGERAAPMSPEHGRPGGGSVVADWNGDFRHQLTLTRACKATITYTGTVSGLSGSVTVLVIRSDHELPTTGTDGSTYLRIGITGLGIVLVGSLLVALTVRRRRAGARLGG